MNSKIFKKIISFSFIFLFCGLASLTMAATDETQALKDEVKALKERISEMEKNSSSQIKTPPTGSALIQPDADEMNPFTEMERMHKEMNRMFSDSMGRGLGSQSSGMLGRESLFDQQLDVQDEGGHYVVKMDIPGMQKNDINVEVKNGMLSVSGERSNETEEQKPNQFYRKERSFGKFSRKVPLPDDAKADDVAADYKNGVLTVKIGKVVQAETKTKVPQKIQVN